MDADRRDMGSGDVCWLKYSAVVGLTVFHHEDGLLEALSACSERTVDKMSGGDVVLRLAET
jgi:hypothetical protein